MRRRFSGSFGFPRSFRRSDALALAPFEILQLTRHDALVTIRSDPTHIPIVEARDRIAPLARVLARLGEGHFLLSFFWNYLLRLGEMRVVIVAHRADRKTARAIAERTNDAQQPLPETEMIARAHHRDLLLGRGACCLRLDE